MGLHGPLRCPAGRGRGAAAIAERYARGFRTLLGREEETILVVCHSPDRRRAGAAAAASAKMPLITPAEPHILHEPSLRRRNGSRSGFGPGASMRRLLLLAVVLTRRWVCLWSPPTSSTGGHNRAMDFLERVEEQIRRHELIPRRRHPPVSGARTPRAVARLQRSYAVSALHVNYTCGAPSRTRTRVRRRLRREVVEAPPASTEAELRELRYSFATDRLRATATRPPTRSRPSSTVQVERKPGDQAEGGRGSSAARRLARRDGGVLRPSGCRSAATRPTRRRSAG